MLETRYSRVSQRAKEHRARFACDALVDVARVRGPVLKVTFCPEIEPPEVQRESALISIKLEHASRLADDLGANPVAWDDRDELAGRFARHDLSGPSGLGNCTGNIRRTGDSRHVPVATIQMTERVYESHSNPSGARADDIRNKIIAQV